MLLEICASNYQSAINAQEAGADRIELCENLATGGITPGHELVERVLKELSIPVYILIRPREGDFVFSDKEFDEMKQKIRSYKEMGCHGIVSGVLNNEKTIDLDRTKKLIDLTNPLPFTFHRAFDEIINPYEGLESLIDIGASRILTSGQASSAEEGIELLKSLLVASNNRIIILPGAGIQPDNCSLFNQKGFKEIHASATLGAEVSQNEIIKGILRKIYE